MPLDLSTVDFIADNSNTSIEHPVAGKNKAFYPVSVLRFLHFQKLAGRLSSATRELFHDQASEAGAQSETNVQEQLGSRTSQSTALPMSVSLSESHRAARLKDMEAIFASLDEATMAHLGLIVLDSMRDQFVRDPAKPFTTADGLHFASTAPAGVFLECCIGAFKASMDSFAPFAKKAMAGLAAKVKTTLDK